MSEEVKQFIQLLSVAYAEIEGAKMVSQGRQWCPVCRAWTFSNTNKGRCDLCHRPYVVGL